MALRGRGKGSNCQPLETLLEVADMLPSCQMRDRSRLSASRRREGGSGGGEESECRGPCARGLQPEAGQRSEQVERPGPLGEGTSASLEEPHLRALISELFTGAVRGNNGTVSELSKEASCQDIKAPKDAFSFAGSSDRAINRFHCSSSRVDLLCV